MKLNPYKQPAAIAAIRITGSCKIYETASFMPVSGFPKSLKLIAFRCLAGIISSVFWLSLLKLATAVRSSKLFQFFTGFFRY